MFGNQPIDPYLRGKFDFFSGFFIGGVGGSDYQAAAAFGQGQHFVAGAQLAVEQVFRDAVGIQGLHVHQGDAKNPGNMVGQIGRRKHAGCNQLRGKTGFAGQGFLGKFFASGSGKLARSNQGTGQASERGRCCRRCHCGADEPVKSAEQLSIIGNSIA